MKRFSSILLGVFALVLGGAEVRPAFTDIDVNLDFLDPPRISGVGSSHASKRITGANSRWAVFEIKFNPVVLEPRKDRNRRVDAKRSTYRSNKKRVTTQTFRISDYRRITGMWLDDVVLSIRVILLDNRSKNKGGYSEVSGQCTFWSIAMDDQSHRAKMFIPPQILDRLMPSTGRSKSGVSGRMAQKNDLIAEVIFYHKKYGVIGESYYGLTARDERAQRREFKEKAQSVWSRNVFRGAAVTRSRTPWGLGDMNNYDLVKPENIPELIDVRQVAPQK